VVSATIAALAISIAPERMTNIYQLRHAPLLQPCKLADAPVRVRQPLAVSPA
jgi:hypothetical protein